ncbi:MAG: hypothetical protein K2G60_05205 [Oscillospiraceae bacterium]|nr:hypothetical protein [Oscillospiraceae bacterium]
MSEKTNSLVLKVLLKIISVFLALVFLLSALGAVAITGVRHFFGDGEFESMVSETDLNEVKFTSNGKTYTASDYVYEAVTEIMPSAVKNYSNMLGSIFGGAVNNAIKEIISSDTVDAIVKTTMMECVDYYLNSDVKAAKERLKSDIKIVDNAKAYENVKTPEEAIRIYVRSFIINTVENTSGISSDRIIVLLSKNTANLLIAAAVISAILLIICNLGCLFDLLLHFGGASFAFGVVVKMLQSKFESSQTDKTLIGYQMLKPLVDSFSPNATAGIIFGILLIAAFLALFILYKSKDKAQENNA